MAAIKIEHRMGIQAPAEIIWSQVSDIAAWSEWNPLYPRAEGALRIGGVLTLDVALPGETVRTLRPTIIDWVPNEQILWRATVFGTLLRATRYIEIEQLTAVGCIFANGELFEGPAAGFLPRRLRAAARAGFRVMGEAVKARAEAAWQATGEVPT